MVLYYGKDGEVKKISEPDIISAFLLSDGEEIAWISGSENSNKCTVKKLKDGEITTLTENAANFDFSGFYMTPFMGSSEGNSLIWYEDFNVDEWSYKAYFHKDGVTSLLGENIEVRCLTNDGRIFYEQGGMFFVQNGTDSANRVFLTDYKPHTDTAALGEWNVKSLDQISYSQSDFSTLGLYEWNIENSDYISLSQPDVSNIYVRPLNSDYSKVIINVSLMGDQKNYYYEEGKTPIFITDKGLEVVEPKDGDDADDISKYYFTTENEDNSINIFRFDGELIPVLDFGVQSFKTFADTDNFLYETDGKLWMYDSKTGSAISLFEYESSSYGFYTAASDLKLIFVRERTEDNKRPLYAVKPDGVTTKIADDIVDFYIDGETLYYTANGYVLHVYENGNSERLISFAENHAGLINYAPIRGRDGGYLEIDVYVDPVNGDLSDHTNCYISIDGRNFVNVTDYVD
jgi:hypothetical protein